MVKITQRKYFKTKLSTVTIGSVNEASRIVSDITLSGGEKDQTDIEAIDGQEYSFLGGATSCTIEFDFIQSDTWNIEEIVYAPSTIGAGTAFQWDGAGLVKTITIANVRTADNVTITVTLTDVEGKSCPVVYTLGTTLVRRFTGIVSTDNVLEVLTNA